MGTVLKFERQATEKHKLFKADADQRLVWGEVYVPGFPDSQGDFMSAAQVQKMAHRYMAGGGSPDFGAQCVDVEHDGEIRKCDIVESFIVRKGDPDFIEGSWVVCCHVRDPQIWDAIKKGDFNGFSMEALVFDEPRDIDVDFPDNIQGKTYKADNGSDHTHTYYVSLDCDGQIINGRTDMVEGHYHVIRRGTITEPADGHKHKFSFLDEINLAA